MLMISQRMMLANLFQLTSLVVRVPGILPVVPLMKTMRMMPSPLLFQMMELMYADSLSMTMVESPMLRIDHQRD